MIETHGVVVKVENDFAYVQTRRESACGGCNSQEGCGTATLSAIWEGKPTQFKVVNGVGANTGDSVIIGVEEKVLLKSSLTAYLLPVAGLVVGMAVALLAAPQAGDGGTVTGAGFGLVTGFWGLRQFNRRRGNRLEYMPVILRLATSWRPISFPKRIDG